MILLCTFSYSKTTSTDGTLHSVNLISKILQLVEANLPAGDRSSLAQPTIALRVKPGTGAMLAPIEN
ncbi:MAG: hypothetical protein PHO08_16810 [Methylococcales bacterium]|nr:hypothetical protein [Methylococcales bacterium]MDD5631811.1 hypothetical protein [Methylococcales bacterium]